MGRLAILFACVLPICAQTLADRVQALENRHSAVQRAAWGAQFIDVSTGEVVFEKNSDSFFVPASNAKLFSAAFALSELGPDYRFATRVASALPPSPDGRIEGDLVVVGGGDPTISGRPYPYRRDAARGDPLDPLDDLARQIHDAGVRRIAGDIVGDDRAYLWEPTEPGWSQDDALYDYGAPVSALVLGDNAVRVRIRPGETGSLARVFVDPEVGYFDVHSQVRTVERGQETGVEKERSPGSRELQLRGQIARADGRDLFLAVDDPARYFAHAFRERLIERGVVVDGVARARHRFDGGADFAGGDEPHVLARRLSPPLNEVIEIVHKESQNLHAEILLREGARQGRGFTSREKALREMERFLQSIGIASRMHDLTDGAGLSRLSLVSPAAITRLLRAMWQSPERDPWLASLPVGGRDGTLAQRFSGLRTRGVTVRAKTGTLTHVVALSGYLETQTGRTLAFSILINNVNDRNAPARAFADGLVTLLSE
jgi:D-alanyl-D-alanine carboxypeptidase/D-alanyl-D-alanine-endopeptidase (penicillin-binding protein 4)